MFIVYEEDILVGVFSDTAMKDKWLSESTEREAFEVPLMDKSFAQMSVEYNHKYEQ